MEATTAKNSRPQATIKHSSKLTTLEHGQAVTTTQKIASHFGMRHAKVMEVISSVLADNPDLRVLSKDAYSPMFSPYVAEYRSNEFTAYQLNESAFMLVVMRFTTKKARVIQRQFVESFQQMKSHLLQAEANKHNLLFQKLRDDGKVTRRSFTDEVQVFAEYSKAQGSNGHAHNFSNFTRWIYKALDIEVTNSPKSRDSLRVEQLEALDSLESEVASLINSGMADGLHYKQIKSDVRAFILEG
jgi:Rha family phage regulatory protein